MHPILVVLAVIVGCAFVWLAGVVAWAAQDLRAGAPLVIPLATIGVAVLLAAGLGMAGVVT